MRGFSLVELSIVLVILGLLTGGIMAGQSLIRASTLRSVATDLNKLETATAAFRNKYGAFPGDIIDATRYWGTGATCPTDTTGGTCNGNGDGYITCAAYTGCEMTYADQHLALAGMIEGSYNPNWPNSAAPTHKVYAYPLKLGLNSVILGSSGAYPAVYYNNFGGGTYLYAAQIATNPYYSGYLNLSIPCEDAWQIDQKMDDGKPGLGDVVAPRNFCVTDTNGANYTTAEYLVSSTGNTLLTKILP